MQAVAAAEVDAVADAGAELDPVGFAVVLATVGSVELGSVEVTVAADDVDSAAAEDEDEGADEDTVSPELLEDEHAAIDVRATLASAIRTSAAVRAGLCTQKG